MKRYLILILPVFLIFGSLYSQQSEQYTKYKFIKKNNSVIIGEIVEKLDGKPYKILLDNGVIIEIREQEIYRMKPLSTSTVAALSVPFEQPNYKWGFSAEASGLSNTRFNIGSPGISTGLTVAAHRYINYHLALGFGTGVFNYDLDSRRQLIPVHGDIKWRFVKNFSTPFIQLKAGYALASNNFINGLIDKKGGSFYNPFLGYEFGVKNKISWSLGLGVVFQKAYYEYQEGTTFADEDIVFRRTEFKIGIAFH